MNKFCMKMEEKLNLLSCLDVMTFVKNCPYHTDSYGNEKSM